MVTKLDAEKIKYSRALEDFETQYEKFKNENVKKTSPVSFEVTTVEPVEVYIALSQYIHSAAVLIETGIDITQISGKNRSFISAIRYIDNLLKHGKEEIGIEELLSSTPKMSGEVKKIGYGKAVTADMVVVSLWKDIPSHITIARENIGQKNNYDLCIKGQEVIETVNILDAIIRKYINF